ncbi:unnamed protein product [Aphanomyces euteiches]
MGCASSSQVEYVPPQTQPTPQLKSEASVRMRQKSTRETPVTPRKTTDGRRAASRKSSGGDHKSPRGDRRVASRKLSGGDRQARKSTKKQGFSINWADYRELSPFWSQFFIDSADITFVRNAPSNYMTTDIGLHAGQSVLIKYAQPNMPIEPQEQMRKALVSEITSMTRLNHPNIVQFKGFSISPEKGLMCITESMEGKTLRDVLDNRKRFAKLTWANDKIQLAIDICSAMVYMHGLKPKLIHRNIKASKVLLNKSCTVAKLSGFGVSRNRSYIKEMTNKIGDVEWSAPELIMDNSDYTEKVDVYSFGVVLIELDTGEMPLREARDTMNATDFTNKIIAGKLRPQAGPTCPPVIERIVRTCLQLDPHKRPPSHAVLDMLMAAKEELASM